MLQKLVFEPFDLEVYMLTCEASSVGAKKRLEIVEKARKFGVSLTNGNARLAKEE